MYFVYDNYESLKKARNRVEECSCAFEMAKISDFEFEMQKVNAKSFNVLVKCPDDIGTRDDVAKIIRSACISYRKMKREEQERNEAI